jgi:hypothetical protein
MPSLRDILLRLAITLCLAITFLAPGLAAQASTSFRVTVTNDAVDTNPGDGRCRTAAGTCTLRAAMMEANARPGRNAIRLPAATYTLSIPGPDQDASAGDLNITDALILTGAGQASTTITTTDRCNLGTEGILQAAASLTLRGVRLRGGCTDGNGGALTTSAAATLIGVAVVDNEADGVGSGILVTTAGSLTMLGGSLAHNTANSVSGAIGGTLANNGTARLRGVAVLNNRGGLDSTGGIVNRGTMSIRDATIADNIMGGEHFGGAGIINEGTLTIRNTRLLRNQATRPDGVAAGALLNVGTATITDAIFDANSGDSGAGAIYNWGGTLSLRRVSFTNNSTVTTPVGLNGGGALANGGRATLHDVVFRHNHITGQRGGFESPRGGAIFNLNLRGTSLDAVNLTLDGNTADGAGGGLWSNAPFTLRNVTIANNAAPTGSGIATTTPTGRARMVNVTVAANTAEPAGASIDTASGLEVSNTIIARKHGTPGADCAGPLASLGGNLASDQSCHFDGRKDQNGVDPRLARRLRRSHGSYTPVLALLARSPALDRGVGPGCPGNDQRGIARPIDSDRDGDATCDIGAFEYQP